MNAAMRSSGSARPEQVPALPSLLKQSSGSPKDSASKDNAKG